VAISSSAGSSARVPSRRVTTAVGSLLMAIAAIAFKNLPLFLHLGPQLAAKKAPPGCGAETSIRRAPDYDPFIL
jgi:hypothetical protein